MMWKTKTMWKTAGRLVVLVLAASIGTSAAAGGDLRLVYAAKEGDRNAVRALLKQVADVGAAEGDGTTALHWVAYRDDAESAALLIRAGARVNVANDLGATPLWAACENGSAAMVRTLLEAGANPNMALRSGETPLMSAARTGNAEVVRQLIAKGADVNAKERAHDQTALMWAVAQQHPAVVEVLLAHGADLRARSNVRTEVVKTAAQDERNPDYTIDIQGGGYTPLLFAARVGDLASAQRLVAAGAEVNDTAPYGTSALVVAAHSGHGKLAAFLVERGADPNAVGAGYTALHAAILHKDEELVAALLARGANPNSPVQRATPTRRDSADFYLPPASVGATPFWLAARYKAPGVMRLLARHGADPLVVHRVAYWSGGPTRGDDDGSPGGSRSRLLIDEGGITALMAAVGMGGKSWTAVANVGDDGPLFAVNRLDRIAEDAEAGANRSPDSVEVESVTLEAVKIAAELGVNVNAANADADTALHAAAVRGFDSVVKFLVERGARLDARNKKGQTPLAAAVAVSSGRPSRYQGFSPTKSTLELLRSLEATK